MGKLCNIIIFCLYIQAVCGDRDDEPTGRNTTPPCVQCPKKTTTRHTTTHSTIHTTHSTLHTTVTQTTTHTNHTTPHPTTHTNHTTPHPTTHTNHTATPYPTTHTNHTTTPHPTTHTNHTTTPHPTTHTNHTTTSHPTTHTNHTSAPHPTAHTNHTSTPTAHASTTHFTTVPARNYTSHPPTPVPPTEYIVNGTAGVCLRIRASFKISCNDTTKPEIVIPPAPTTQASGNCSAEKAWLTLTFPLGQVAIIFRKDTEGNNFFLGAVNITLNTGSDKFDNDSLKDMVTPLGRSFSCGEVDIHVTSKVTFSVMDVKAQAFKLEGGNFGREMKCSGGLHSMTVPIVVGIVLLVLILIVVIAYFVARQRSPRGYQPL